MYALPLLSIASIVLASTHSLSDTERDRLRYRLENLWNEVELLVRNHEADRLDVNRQDREFRTLHVFERIPFKDDLAELQKQLATSATRHSVHLKQLVVTGRSPDPPKPPRSVKTNHKPVFRLTDDQVTQRIHLRIIVAGDEAQIHAWANTWHDDVMRIVELHKSRELNQQTRLWELTATTYRFRDVRFPALIPGDPMELLPEWARKNPVAFSKNEPLLWNFVVKTQSLAPRAKPLYRTREHFLLNDARVRFFLARTENHEHH